MSLNLFPHWSLIFEAEDAAHADHSPDFPMSYCVYQHLNHSKEKCSHVHRESEGESQSHLIKVKNPSVLRY